MAVRLLVEGKDDLSLITNLLSNHQIPVDETLEIHDCKGVQGLLRDSLRLSLEANYDAVGVIVDADLDLRARWDAVRNRLRASGYAPPIEPSPDGLVLTDRVPAVGVWLMPNNVLPGTIEDFARLLIPDADEWWPRAADAVAALPRPRRFPDARQRKAEMHTYLAWQEEPGTPLGLAITKKYFQTDTALAHRFADWIRRLRNVRN
jgi:hypothetical protein